MMINFLRDSFFNYDEELEINAGPLEAEGLGTAGKDSKPIRQGRSGIEQNNREKDCHEVISTQVRDTPSFC